MFNRSLDIAEFEKHFTTTKRDSVNICPGLRCCYSWSRAEAIELDRRGGLIGAVKERVNDVLAIWGSSLEMVIP